jgi:ADP-ribose pyrophosphatase YjhB (NUDIX family)
MKNRQRVQAIIIQNNKVLFGAGIVNGKEFRHFFIGGGVEEGESSDEAVIRELKEEANVDGTIIFKFTKEYKKNHHTFLVDIGNQTTSLGYDPEDEEVEMLIHLRTLQRIEFIPIEEYDRFTLIDIEYFRILIEECNNRGISSQWINAMKTLVQNYEGEHI